MGGLIKKIPDWFRSLSDKKIYLILAGIIACQLAVITFIFATEKIAFYSDEMYSYGIANSDISGLCLDDGKSYTGYSDKWIDGSVFRDYLTVSENGRFDYRQIYSNLKMDAHPPLYYMLLHTVCSFFPDTFSIWYGYLINIFAFIVLQIYIFRLTYELCRRRSVALAVCLFFGFTAGAYDITSYVRMYAWLTAFSVVYTYYSVMAIHRSDVFKDVRKYIVLAAVSLYIGSMFQYLIIAYAFLFTILSCIYYLTKRRYRMLLAYGMTMLCSIILMLFSFPVFFKQLDLNPSAMNGASRYPFMFEVRIAFCIVMSELFGIDTPVHKNMFFFWLRMAIYALIIIYLIACFLFRKDEWFRPVRKAVRSIPGRLWRYLKRMDKAYLVLAGTSAAMFIYISRNFKIFYYSSFADRYLFIIYPFVSILIIVLLFKLFEKINREWILAAAVIILILISYINGSRPYLFYQRGMDKLSDWADHTDVIAVMGNSADIASYTGELINVNKAYITIYDDIDDQTAALNKYEEDGRPLYLMIHKTISMFGNNEDAYTKIIDYISEQPFCTRCDYVSETVNEIVYRIR